MSQVEKFSVSLKLLLKNKKGEVLTLFTPKTNHVFGFRDFPGGRIDTTEREKTLKEILFREVKEELWPNVKVEISDKVISNWRTFVPWTNTDYWKEEAVFYQLFEAKYLWGEIQISEEHLWFEWVDLKKIELEKYFCFGLLEALKNLNVWKN